MKQKIKPVKLPDIFQQACVASSLPQPVAEFQFHPDRKWRIDYYFQHDTRRVALEVEGGVYTGGRHTRSAGFLGDIEKYNALSVAGIFLVRVTPGELLRAATFNTIKAVLYGQD